MAHRRPLPFCCFVASLVLTGFARAEDAALSGEELRKAGELLAQLADPDTIKSAQARSEFLRLALADFGKIEAWDAFLERRRTEMPAAPIPPLHLKTRARLVGEYLFPDGGADAKIVFDAAGGVRMLRYDGAGNRWEERVTGTYAVDPGGCVNLSGSARGVRELADAGGYIAWQTALHFSQDNLCDGGGAPLARIDAKKEALAKLGAPVESAPAEIPLAYSMMYLPAPNANLAAEWVVLDCSHCMALDKDKTCEWRQIDGPSVLFPADAGKPTVSWFAPREGHYKFQLTVFKEQHPSLPHILEFDVGRAPAAGDPPWATRLVAIPRATAAAPMALTNENSEPNVILDGSRSTPASKMLTYVWKQTRGEDLKLRDDELRQAKVGVRIYKAGAYRFELTVYDGLTASAPAEADVKILAPFDTALPHVDIDDILVFGQIEGRWARLALDSGSGSTRLFHHSADRLGVRTWNMSMEPFRLMGGRQMAEAGEFTMNFLGRTKKFSDAGVHTLPECMTFYEDDGVLSWKELNDTIYEIDVARQEFKFLDAPPADTAGWTRHKLLADSYMLRFECSEGATTIVLAVDTGANHGILLNPERWKAWRGARAKERGTLEGGYWPGGGPNGMTVNDVLRARRFSIGGLDFPDMEMSVFTELHKDLAEKCDAVLGMFALSRFAMIVDPKGGFVYTRPNDNAETGRYNMLGAEFVPLSLEQPGPFVAHVVKDGPAYEAGIRDGDVLIKMGRIDLTQWCPNQPYPWLHRNFFSRPDGTKLKLTVQRDGKQIEAEATLMGLKACD